MPGGARASACSLGSACSALHGAAGLARRASCWRLLGALYGAAHFALQGKGWEYQLYPLALFLCALAPGRRALAAPGRRARLADLAGRRARAVALAAWALLVLVLGAKGVEAREPAWIAEKARRVARLTRDLAPLAPPGETVQVLDTTAGGIHALLRLGLRQPTRFIYDFHFFHDADDPRIRRSCARS